MHPNVIATIDLGVAAVVVHALDVIGSSPATTTVLAAIAYPVLRIAVDELKAWRRARRKQQAPEEKS